MLKRWLLLFPATAIAVVMTPVTCADDNSTSVLARARALGTSKPSVALKKGGEFEGYDWWEKHGSLFTRAWAELPPLHPELFSFNNEFKARFVDKNMRNAVEALRSDGSHLTDMREAAIINTVLYPSPSVRGVYVTSPYGIFTREFCTLLLEELNHRSASGIPIRRPNGMNRFGAILDDIGFEVVFQEIANEFIRPLAEALYPDRIGAGDAHDHYAFTVEYMAEGDVELKEHRDASVATLNICLGYSGFEGGALRFYEDGSKKTGGFAEAHGAQGGGEIVMHPGLSIFHLGQHRHAALPLTGGHRVNLVVWLFGQGDTVRVAPYLPSEQMTAVERWKLPRNE